MEAARTRVEAALSAMLSTSVEMTTVELGRGFGRAILRRNGGGGFSFGVGWVEPLNLTLTWMARACRDSTDRQEFAAKEALRSYRQLMEDRVAAVSAAAAAGARSVGWRLMQECFTDRQLRVCPGQLAIVRI